MLARVQGAQHKGFNVGVSAAPQAGFEVELKVAVILRYFNHVTKSPAAQWSAAEVGVENYAGCIDDWAK